MVKASTQRKMNNRAKVMEVIVSQHETALLQYAARLVNSPATAQDVVQNVFIKLFKNWDGHSQPSKSIKSWLFRVTHNEAVDLIRRESRLTLLHKQHAEEQEIRRSKGKSGGMNDDDRKAAVLQHLKTLHPREQQVILLRLEQGLSYKEIAAITGHNESYVGNILHHSIRKLSTVLQQEGVIAA
jgi:RNA polymerase sigma-70 factor (ECF subfamily)